MYTLPYLYGGRTGQRGRLHGFTRCHRADDQLNVHVRQETTHGSRSVMAVALV